MNPQRTCIGCRVVCDQASLVRLCWQEPTGVVVDVSRTLGGRGCYLHPGCAAEAIRRRAVGRALRRTVDPAQVAGALGARPAD